MEVKTDVKKAGKTGGEAERKMGGEAPFLFPASFCFVGRFGYKRWPRRESGICRTRALFAKRKHARPRGNGSFAEAACGVDLPLSLFATRVSTVASLFRWDCGRRMARLIPVVASVARWIQPNIAKRRSRSIRTGGRLQVRSGGIRTGRA